MNSTAPFRMNKSALMLALVSAAFAGNAGASAGRIDFSIGGVVATRPNGQERPLAKGAELESGDTIRTNDGRAQIRFPDGAYVSLQPNTVFGVREYNYEGRTDGKERGFFSLLKGAMRAVTGLIGRVNRSTFQITTPTATVGIRGTGGLIAVLPDGSTLIRGSSGIWSLSNASGSIDVPAGASGLAPADPSQPPQETNGIPQVPPAPPFEYVTGDQRTSTGDPIIPVIPLQSGSGYAAALAYHYYGSAYVDASASATAMFNDAGQLTSVGGSGLGLGGNFVLVNGTVVESGNDGIIAWGRWIGDATLPLDGNLSYTFDNSQSLHYVIGTPTPVMPTTGSAIFTLLGATSPTYADGRTGPGTFNGSLEVLFGPGAATVNMVFAVNMPDGNGYAIGGSTTTGPGAMFSANPTVVGVAGNACGSGCNASVQGFFAGTNAARAGVAYNIQDYPATGGGSGTILGAAAFKNTGVPVPLPQ
ncbi:MAG: FecR family protein [Burkholderiales bacterium]